MVEKYFEILNPKFYEKPIQIVDKADGTKRIYKNYLETIWHKSHVADSEPKVLTLDDLEFGFVVWLASIVLPLIAFLLEIISIFITKIINRKQINAIHQEANDSIEMFEKTQVEEISITSTENMKKNNTGRLKSFEIITIEQIENDVFGSKIMEEEEDFFTNNFSFKYCSMHGSKFHNLSK
jgi:hypothetical protein